MHDAPECVQHKILLENRNNGNKYMLAKILNTQTPEYINVSIIIGV